MADTPIEQQLPDMQMAQVPEQQGPIQPQPQQASKTLSTKTIPLMEDIVLNKPYNEAKEYLKGLYNNVPWDDSEKAADEIAGLALKVQQQNGALPEIHVGPEIANLSGVLMSHTYTDEEKLGAIEDWRAKEKQRMYNSSNFDDIFTARAAENEVDGIANQLSYGVTNGDVGAIRDHFTRGVTAALSPLWGTADAVLGTDTEKTSKEFLAGGLNPKYEGSISAKASGLVGSIAGAMVSGFNPMSAYAYLGAMAVDQGKSVWDTAYEETGSSAAANEALLKASPFIGIGLVGDRILSAGFGQAAKYGVMEAAAIKAATTPEARAAAIEAAEQSIASAPKQ
jgi:hypothetical protein